MKVRWAQRAVHDIRRLENFLAIKAPEYALRMRKRLVEAPSLLTDNPRIGERLPNHGEREVRRLTVDQYEMRYELLDGQIEILRIWHMREDRPG